MASAALVAPSQRPQPFDPESFLATAAVAKQKRGMSAFAYRWRVAYAETLWLDPVLAAEKAGFTRPAEAALRMLRKYSDVIASDKASLWAVQEMSVDECRALLAQVARGQRAASPQQVKAIELVLKVAGLLTDKVDVALPLGSLDKAFARSLEHKALPVAPVAGQTTAP